MCNRRRIKCDRSLPSCQKCKIRKLECTGYDRKLKWNQGVASRGHYAGQAAPIPRVALCTNRELDAARPKQLGSTPDSAPTAPPSNRIDESLSRYSSSNSTSDEYDDVEAIDGKYGVDLALSWSQLPHIYQDPDVRRLINHYDHHVATTFVWIDSPDNRWRNDVLPLAQESPSLLFAILALSSSHLSSKLPVNELPSRKISTQSIQYRERSLQLLAQQLADEAQKNCSATSIHLILATMLILCNLEMVHSDSAIWRVHLKASQIMIQRWLSTACPMDLLDTTSQFIITQFSILNVFASTSTFGNIDEVSDIESVKEEPTIFSDYLETIHAITTEERKWAALREVGGTLVGADLKFLATRLENARNMTRSLSRHLYFSTELLKRDFDRIVDIYHHSGLIYAYQALAKTSDAAICIPPLLDSLIQDLTLISTSGHFAQDLAWPLFISGTACRHLKDKQRLLKRLLQECMKSTGFSNCQGVLKFLHVFWSESEVEGDNWIGYARSYAKLGQEFLVF